MASAPASRSLPPDFTSLYRLFLRSSAASVLNNGLATRRLRALWRPTFNAAAEVSHRLQRDQLPPIEAAKLEQWYRVWQHRMDNTLSLLCVSAVSRGLPHQLTRNIARLVSAHHHYLSRKGKSQRQYWNPQLPAKDYKPVTIVVGSRIDNATVRRARHAKANDMAWGALGEAIMMAEGRQRITLGRIPKHIKVLENARPP